MAKILNDNEIQIIDDEGNEYLYNILFTYENEERGCQYVFIYDKANPSDVYVMKYSDNGELFEVTDEEELEEADEVLAAYEEDPKINDIK